MYVLKKDLGRYWNMVQGNKLEKVVRCYRQQGVHAIITYRFGQWLLKKNIFIRFFLTPIYAFQNHRMIAKWGISLRRKGEIGEGFFISHYGGIHIAEKAKIGKYVNISQDVTIGVSGQGDNRGWPTIGDYVYIAPGAKIFGKIKIGNNVKIGANAVIYKDIPDNCIVVLDGLKIISRDPSKFHVNNEF